MPRDSLPQAVGVDIGIGDVATWTSLSKRSATGPIANLSARARAVARSAPESGPFCEGTTDCIVEGLDGSWGTRAPYAPSFKMKRGP